MEIRAGTSRETRTPRGYFDNPKKINEVTDETQLKLQKEDNTMNRSESRVTLIDNTPGLKASKSLVFATTVISDGTKEDIIRNVLFQGDVVEALHKHNDMRKGVINEEILNRVGNEVNLRAVELDDLTWSVTPA